MSMEKGSLSINSENIFPIIKKWLYSDHDIFFRELISNACDAVTKLKKLEVMGEYSIPETDELKVEVIVNPEEKTLTFIDNGIGMTADEVKEYINQIAFSGAQDFLAKYKDKASEEQIIGHFGLGFYSAFMVAHKVTIETLSWQKDAKPVYWESEEGTDFEMGEGDKAERGTKITLYLNEDSYEFSNEYRAKEVIEKYCSFMPIPIFFSNANAPVEEAKEEEKTDVVDAEVSEDGKATETKEEKKGPKPINDPNPLWTKHPNDCKEEDYKEFYRNVFHDYKEPLFWIHLNMDYPFNLKGILYFPKINTEYDSIEGTIKLYSNQVFIADNIKEVIPEFLMLLKGVIDCPDLPLNVSRSALQNDGFVKKISDYITKKVADKLSGMYKVERETYEKYWDDISPFIKFGCLKDEKFREKIKDFILFKNLDNKYLTMKEYMEKVKPADEGVEVAEVESKDEAKDENKEVKKTTIYYVTDPVQQSQYINMFKDAGMDAVLLTHNIDSPFITQLEQSDEKLHFARIDADVNDNFTEKVDEKELEGQKDSLTKLFRDALKNEKLDVKVVKLKNEKVSSMITLSEESRRMQDMMKMYNMYGMDPSAFGNAETLVLNANNELVKYVLANETGDKTAMICEQLYDLAMISHKPLSPEAMTKFVERSNEIMVLLTK
ncbi:MAG: molecular chaperone HtpG [Clostridiales bacterium]|nr:molecular chaperone HtpG [Clostridiales bacterium]